MISVNEAYHLLHTQSKEFGTEVIGLLQSVNRQLATPVFADRDLPPYNRAIMDGIAINNKSFKEGRRQFFIEKISAAGSAVTSLDNNLHCVEVMTGAVLPNNTDCIIPYEQCEINNGFAVVKTETAEPFQHVHRQGKDEKKGACLLAKKERITPAAISVMATVGLPEIEVYQLPRVAVCSTGDELVAIADTPLPHQVRQSNAYLLAAALQKENITASLHHLPDDEGIMKQQLAAVLRDHDVVLLSGAVSKGRFDYLPAVLSELGMKTVFHQVAQRPGKPFLFGTINSKTVFGFPGNPVSTFVCYHLFFKHWLYRSIHFEISPVMASLAEDVYSSPSLTHHILVTLFYEKDRCLAKQIHISSSGDIPALVGADGIISLPPGKAVYKKGEVFDVVGCR